MCDVTRQDTMTQVLWYWLPVALYAGLIFFLSSQSHPEDTLPSFLFKEVSDKVLHAVEYGILAVLCYRAFRWAAGPALARQAVVLAIVTASVYGITDEVHQAFVPLRESSWQDWLADTIGAVIGVMSWRSIGSD
ncbi:MAG: VanZ family protein [Nitrospirota bacterium]|nr:VanZ family protein [Nitrospirota bacterium]MDP2382367.1 VanZ family protein [Nitrospirota bacterium]MDP3599341.1 VanZ family protein [Nitrospirota bacterium]